MIINKTRHTLTNTVKIVIKQCRVIYLSPISNKYFGQPQRYYISDMPQSSKFSKQLGLQKQLKQVNKAEGFFQKLKVSSMSFIIWVFISALGSLLLIIGFQEQLKSQLFLYTLYLFSSSSQQSASRLLKEILKYLNKFYGDKPFSNKLIDYLLRKIINKYIHKPSQQLLEVLQKNTKNSASKKIKIVNDQTVQFKVNQDIYRYFLENLLLYLKNQNPNYTPNQKLMKILEYTSQFGCLRTLFVTACVLNTKQIDKVLSNKSKKLIGKNLLKKIKYEQELIENTKKRIQQIKQYEDVQMGKSLQDRNLKIVKTMIDPYEYNIKVMLKWVQFAKKIGNKLSQ